MNTNFKDLELSLMKQLIVSKALRLGMVGPKFEARMAGLIDKAETMDLKALSHMERLLDQALMLVEIGVDLFETERKDRSV